MAKSSISASSKATTSKSKKMKMKKQAGEITRGKSHTQLLTQRKSLKSEISKLPKSQQTKILSHYHGGTELSSDLSKSRIQNLKYDDKHNDTSNLSSYQIQTLRKRKLKPNMALQRSMHRRETKRLVNAIEASNAEEILHTQNAGLVEVETDMEKTIQLTQQQLKHGVHQLEENVARNIYNLDLTNYGPYKLRYDRSGKYALLAGKGGHVSIIDQHSLSLSTEFHLENNESIRDAIFLHSGNMMAVSQEKNVYIYDEEGTEIHRLDGHRRVMGMEFLPYHWLLGEFSWLIVFACLCACLCVCLCVELVCRDVVCFAHILCS